MKTRKRQEAVVGNEEKPDTAAADSLVDRLNKYKVLIATVGGVVVVLLTQLNSGIDAVKSLMDKLAPKAAAVEPPCLVANKPSIPPVKSSEWESTRFRLTGQNNCTFRHGVFVTFQRNQARDPRVRAPRFDREGCDRGEPVTKAECGWRAEIPLQKGPWEIDVALPPLERLNNAPEKETVELVIEIRDLEHPNMPPQWSTVAAVQQLNSL